MESVMPIIMTARYQVRPQSIDRCKQAIINLVEYVKENEKGTLYYIANQEKLNPYTFLHTMIFKDEVALTMHRSSEAAEKFVNVIYPAAIDPLEFKEYNEIGHNLNFGNQ
jgi:quinol monooxygenase YgiN